MATAPPLTRKIITFLGSTPFFVLVVVVFVLEAAWIAISARYPQAFDEQFHLGIIQIYAHQWSPFFAHQPAGADQYSALTADPSYLYHYLMSFPWRIITHLTRSFTAQVITMRLINVGLMGSSLFIFRKVLAAASFSKALTNTILLLFVLTPVVPLLASQINYDNAIIPLSGLAVLWGIQLAGRIKAGELPLMLGLRLLALCFFASVVKYAFLPIFAALFLLIVLRLWQARRSKRLQVVTPGKTTMAVLGVLVVVGFGLCVKAYGVNMLRYHTPTPECNQVLSVSECEAYAPWARNYAIEQYKTNPPTWQVAAYSLDWLYHCMNELIFTIGSEFNTTGTINYFVGTQLAVIEILAWSVFGLGLTLCIVYARYLWRQEVLRIFMLVIGLYAFALWAQNYSDYLHLGQPIAIHGRYLLPVLPLIYAMVAIAFRRALQARHVLSRLSFSTRKLALAGVVGVILITQGGGIVTYIVRSDRPWFWPQSSPVQTMNAKAQQLLKPLVI